MSTLDDFRAVMDFLEKHNIPYGRATVNYCLQKDGDDLSIPIIGVDPNMALGLDSQVHTMTLYSEPTDESRREGEQLRPLLEEIAGQIHYSFKIAAS